jgi:chromosome segregation protein
MRLTRIKLAGFKSFVDPTSIDLPSSLVGIVGPNGCGKSNTIDAVRWVMGESSAKHLRGESMDDVIFTGSSTRKPVGQASVELVFDNSDGSLGGEYAAYAEISIKREVARDGVSKYSLNNTRCRRRDIRDIFLGTGLGPRSYAIIEQGMISRLIDAKPEELRVYLEEAAGISKYKERRRETENRIRHTRDNLDRLDDLREEVDKQLAHLKRQASTAERFQTLKAEERQKRGELLCLRRQRFTQQRDQQSAEIAKHEKELEEIVAKLRAAESAIEQARVQQTEATDNFNTVQANFYKIGSEVSRIEQTIEHTRESRRSQSQELAEVERILDETQKHVADDSKRIQEIDEVLAKDQPAIDQLKDSQRISAELLTRTETELSESRARHEAFNVRQGDAQRSAQVERSTIEELERNIENATARLERLRSEMNAVNGAEVSALIDASVADETLAIAEEQRLQANLEKSGEKQKHLRENIRRCTVELNDARANVQAKLGRLASLEALQQAALEPDSNAADTWLHMNELDQQPKLAQAITANPGWEKAVELVLGAHLEAVCVNGSDAIERCLRDVPAAQLTLLTAQADSGSAAPNMLRSKVTGEVALNDLMVGVYAADSLTDAMALRPRLGAGESVVTKDGLWLGRQWLRVARADSQDSVLLRETEIAELREELTQLEADVEALEASSAELSQSLSEHETQRETLQHSFNDAVRALSNVQSVLLSNRQRLEQQQQRNKQLQEEITEVQAMSEQDKQRLESAVTKRNEALKLLDELEVEKTLINDEKEGLEKAVEEARKEADTERDAGQELAIRVESMRSAREATTQNLERMASRIEQLTQRRDMLNELLAKEDEDPLTALEATLKDTLSSRLAAETALSQSRTQLDKVELRLREHEQARLQHDSESQKQRENLQNVRLASQEAVVRLKTIDEQLAEHEYDPEALMNEIVEGATVEAWEDDLQKLEQRISRLGPINLAAIDELTEQETRKEYLDEQYADVTDALATLEHAIAKIDRETRTRFKETFDLVSSKIEEFFPRLFGGGKASLQLTGDDLLSTGVSVMAQPPGKRVSNIQLLSGGEKALTAVAMVFAFFELNPSPFCMLDEVDAPLDDANVGRFCALVKEMSERVQFIFITHNKVTMELSEQLMGVTMNEPGVSRLVSADVNEAVELAGV